MPLACDRFKLIESDLRSADIAPDSIDWIITDPPYPKEYIDVAAAGALPARTGNNARARRCGGRRGAI
jgi:DNA modification methylase